MQFVFGALIAIALAATLVSLMLASIFGDDPMFAALGQMLAIVEAATFAWLHTRATTTERAMSAHGT